VAERCRPRAYTHLVISWQRPLIYLQRPVARFIQAAAANDALDTLCRRLQTGRLRTKVGSEQHRAGRERAEREREIETRKREEKTTETDKLHG